MKIAFTYNLKLKDCEEEAEFDTTHTIEKITASLEKLGHNVHQVEVSGSVSQMIARLESLQPDLIFNTAEGKSGMFREAFYPAVFEELQIPFTGSDAMTYALTLDKYLTKMIVADKGVRIPHAILLTHPDQIREIPANLSLPRIIKPNGEGSSKGIDEKSVVYSYLDLYERAEQKLKAYPKGILVEEFIPGKDITVSMIEGTSAKSFGILPPCEYSFTEKNYGPNTIYDYSLKNENDHAVSVRCPAILNENTYKELMRYAKIVFSCLNIRDLGRIDFRVAENRIVYFIEINALPSLESGAGIYVAAREAGIGDEDAVIASVLKSACKRHNLAHKKPEKKSQILKVGFTYNQKRQMPTEDPSTDQEAEFDSPKTLDAIRNAIRANGFEVIDLEAEPSLIAKLAQNPPDVVFNIAEGIRGRYRESQIPAILDLMGIPYTGSDPSTLSLALDKALSKRIVREAGVDTATFCTLITGKEKLPDNLRWPMIVKPVAEGSSKGVIDGCVVKDEAALRKVVIPLIERYRQPILAEEFLPGREFTVALLGDKNPKVLPPMEIIHNVPADHCPIYTYQHKLNFNEEISYQVPAHIDEKLEKAIKKMALKAFKALGCRDVARIDIRLDKTGKPHFLECNPLPGLTPGWSDLCLICESCGINYTTLIGEILAPAIKRMKPGRRSGGKSGETLIGNMIF